MPLKVDEVKLDLSSTPHWLVWCNIFVKACILGFLMPFVQVEIKSFDCLAYCSVSASWARGKLTHVKVLYKVKVCFLANGSIWGWNDTQLCKLYSLYSSTFCYACFVLKCTHKMQSCVHLHTCVCDVKHMHTPVVLSSKFRKWILPVQTLLKTLTCNDFVWQSF